MYNNLDERKFDKYGNVVFDSNTIINFLYKNNTNISKLPSILDNDIKLYNYYCNLYDKKNECLSEYKEPNISIEEFDEKLIKNWFIPNDYKNINIEEYLYNKCTTQEEINRVTNELELFKKHDLILLLKFMIYFIDTLRENNLIWGVGRGSSVASYILYIIGVHKVNPLKYNIPIEDFFK